MRQFQKIHPRPFTPIWKRNRHQQHHFQHEHKLHKLEGKFWPVRQLCGLPQTDFERRFSIRILCSNSSQAGQKRWHLFEPAFRVYFEFELVENGRKAKGEFEASGRTPANVKWIQKSKLGVCRVSFMFIKICLSNT
jgi:hypothetical protein